MSPKTICQLSGDEIRKECIKLGIRGRFSMKEALIEMAVMLASVGKNPKTHMFFPSQPLLEMSPCNLIILTDLVETLKLSPAPSSTMTLSSISSTTTSVSSSRAFSNGITTSVSARSPICSNIPYYNPYNPPPPIVSSNPTMMTPDVVAPGIKVLENILKVVGNIQDLLQKYSVDKLEKSDSEVESFSSMVSPSNMSSQSRATQSSYGTILPGHPFYQSILSSLSSRSSLSSSTSKMSKKNRWSNQWLKDELICIRFQHGSCDFSDNHSENSHLCALCYMDSNLEASHGGDSCPVVRKEVSTNLRPFSWIKLR